jgi:hypothetical protein
MTNPETDLDFSNYPADGVEGELRENLVFGSGSSTFALLVEYDPPDGPLRITVGNGPPHEDAPLALADVLRDVADLVEGLYERDEYWEALDKLDNKG